MGWGEEETFRTPWHLPDEITADILLRLPTMSLIISGAVCKAWRQVTTHPHFLELRARRRRSSTTSIIVYTLLDAAPWPGHGRVEVEGLELDALPVSADAAIRSRRRLMGYLRFPAFMPQHCLLLGSCEGVILFKKDTGHYLLCNPVTRQWADLPKLDGDYCNKDQEYAFYFHQPSGEFRLLCRNIARSIWFVVSTGAAQPRRLLENTDAAEFIIPCLPMVLSAPVVPLHGNLHWSPHQTYSLTGEEKETHMVAFDVLLETFHRMAGPPVMTDAPAVRLFEMNAMLVAADFDLEGKHIDLWFLKDYNAGRWERRHRVASWPWKDNVLGAPAPNNIFHWLSVAAAGDGDEENVILGNQYGLVVYDVRRSKVVRTIMGPLKLTASWNWEHVCVTRHVFRESLVQHACFGPSVDVPLIHKWC